MTQKPSPTSIDAFQDEIVEHEATIEDYLGDYDEQCMRESSAPRQPASGSHERACKRTQGTSLAPARGELH